MKKIIKNMLRRMIPQWVIERLRTTVYITVHDANKIYTLKQYPPDHLELKGKAVVVTGGSGAIGRAICFKFAANGATVYVGGRNVQNVQRVVDEIRSLNLLAEAFIIDIADSESVDKAFDKINNIDILVNCAGGGSRDKMKNLAQQDITVIDEILNTNLRGTILCTQKAAKKMILHQRGKIIIISSAVGIQGKAAYSEYGAAKAGMIGFCKSIALELGKFCINVNCVSPGFIQRGEYDEQKEKWLKNTNCLHKVGELEDIANAVYFMASDNAKFITGQNLIVDGGRTLGLYGDR